MRRLRLAHFLFLYESEGSGNKQKRFIAERRIIMKKFLSLVLCISLLCGNIVIAETVSEEVVNTETIIEEKTEEIEDVTQSEIKTEDVAEKTDTTVENKEENKVETNIDNSETIVENQETEDKDDNEIEKDNAQEEIVKEDPKQISFLDDMTLQTTITVSAYSRREKVYYTYDINSYSELFDEAQNQSRVDTVKKVYKKLLNMIDFSKEIPMPIKENKVENYYASFKLEGSKNVEIKLYDNKISIGSQAFYVNNPEEITKYIETLKYNELKFFGERNDYIDFGPSYLNAPVRRYTNRQTNQVAEYKNGKKVNHHSDYCKREELYFDVTTDKSYYNTIIEDIADTGTAINCKIERMTSSNKVFTKLTMKGDKKELVLWGELPSNSVPTDTLEFSTGNVIDDGYWYEFDANRKLRNHTIKVYKEDDEIKFKIELNNNNLTEYGMVELKNTNECKVENVSIKYLGNNYELKADKTSMIYGFGLSDVAEHEENTNPNKPQLPQDPEYYVSHLKSIGDYGDIAFDVEVRYVASMKLDEYTNPAGWCAKLGDDIEVTLVGMLQTLYGSPRMTYPMIRFKGSKGTIWFDSGTIMQGTDKDVLYPDMSEQISEDKVAYVSFHSLISFEDKVKIRNTVKYDRLEMYMTFTDETRTELESIKLKLPGKNVVIKVEDMNYIGGGEHGYESWL